ncbi:MAG TPA: hypothetical protein PKY96_00320 [Flavobacteriales bacterium]|nr:hypothetical protein [Flavobacteriales bacterium]HRD51068.1 hypothetical protein [Flavobacteriales bacterium]
MALAAALFGVYLGVRAIHLPLIQDEANSFWWYVASGRFLPLDSHLDAGNHHLSSFFGWLGYSLFGAEPIALRFGSLLAYALYAATLAHLARYVRSGWIRWCCFLALLTCPFLHEYFALFRGYGLAVAFFGLAVLQSVILIEGRKPINAVWLIAAATMAALANLSMLPLCLVMVAVAAILGMHGGFVPARAAHRIGIAAAALGSLAIFVLLAFVSMALKGQGLLYHGAGNGLLAVSVNSLCQAIFGWSASKLPIVCAAMAIGGWLVGLNALYRKQPGSGALVVVGALLGTECIIRIALQEVLGVNYPQDRAAFQMLILFLLLASFAIDELGVRSAWAKASAVVFLALPIITLSSLNAEVAMNNGEPAVPRRFIHRLAQLQLELGRPVITAVGSNLRSGVSFAQFRDAAFIQESEDQRFDHPGQDFRIVRDTELHTVQDGYHAVDSSTAGWVHLLKRDTPLSLDLAFDSTLTAPIEMGEGFRNILEQSPGRFGNRALYVRVTGNLHRRLDHGELHFVVHDDYRDGAAYEDGTDLRKLRLQWAGEPFDIMRRLPAAEVVEGTRCFFWNTTSMPVQMTDVRIRVYVTGQPDPISES